jgi:hypothetical protein
MEKTAAFKVATEGLTLSCAKCGEYTDDARSVALLGGEGGALEQMAGVTFGGPIVASLGQGRCPGCHGDTVNATFDLTRAGIRPAHDQSFDQAVLSDAKSCYFTAATKLAFRKDVERLTEEERFVFVFDTACQLLAEKRQISTKDASDYVKQAILRVGK